jgi:hypothetical protein
MIYRPHPDCVACEFGDGLAVLDIRTNLYFTLDEVGTAVWSCLSNGVSIDHIAAKVTEEFDTTPAECAPDIEVLLAQMLERRLVEVDA